MNWVDVSGHEAFDKLAKPDKQKVAMQYFKDNIASHPNMQELSEPEFNKVFQTFQDETGLWKKNWINKTREGFHKSLDFINSSIIKTGASGYNAMAPQATPYKEKPFEISNEEMEFLKTTPLVPIGQMFEGLDESPLYKKLPENMQGFLKGSGKSIVRTAESFTTLPSLIMLGAFGGTSGIAHKAITVAFAADMGIEAANAGNLLFDELAHEARPEQIGEHLTDMLTAAGFSVAGAVGIHKYNLKEKARIAAEKEYKARIAEEARLKKLSPEELDKIKMEKEVRKIMARYLKEDGNFITKEQIENISQVLSEESKQAPMDLLKEGKDTYLEMTQQLKKMYEPSLEEQYKGAASDAQKNLYKKVFDDQPETLDFLEQAANAKLEWAKIEQETELLKSQMTDDTGLVGRTAAEKFYQSVQKPEKRAAYANPEIVPTREVPRPGSLEMQDVRSEAGLKLRNEILQVHKKMQSKKGQQFDKLTDDLTSKGLYDEKVGYRNPATILGESNKKPVEIVSLSEHLGNIADKTFKLLDEFGRPIEGISPEAQYQRIKPIFDEAFEAYKQGSKELFKSMGLFKRHMHESLGEQIRPFLDMYEKEMILQEKGMLGANPKTIDNNISGEEVGSTSGIVDRFLKTETKLEVLETKHALIDLFDVEAAPKRIGANETGRAFADYKSVIDYYETFAVDAIKKGAELVNYNKQQMYEAIRVAETPEFIHRVSPANRKGVQAYADMWNNLAKKWQADLEKAGLKVDFVERMKQELREKIAESHDPTEISFLQDNLRKAEKMNFVHLPSTLWFEGLNITDPARAGSILNALNVKKRGTFRIADLVEDGIFKPEDLNMSDVIASYSRRVGRDVALGDVINAGLKEGLIKDKPTQGYRRVDGTNHPLIKGRYFHKTLYDWVKTNNAQHYPNNKFLRGTLKTMTAIKMGAFYNPLIMLNNTIKQNIMSGALWHKGAFRDYAEAVKDVRNFSPTYQELLRLGGQSKPFETPFKNMMEVVEHAQMTKGEKYAKLIREIPSKKLVNNIYNISWDMAWQIDHIGRTHTYRQMLKNGLPKKEAAYLTSMYHGRYSMIPQNVRHGLNLALFTPSYKIAMSHLYKNMVTGAAKVGKNGVNGVSPTQKAFGVGLATTIGMVVAWDMFMNSIGFETEEYGRKYVREVKTEKGPKEQVLVFSGPETLPIKYAAKGWNSFSKDNLKVGNKQILKGNVDLTPGTKRFFDSLKFDFHPLWVVGSEVLNNKGRDGELIADPFDHPIVQFRAKAEYALSNTVQLIGFLQDKLVSDEQKKLINKDIDQVIDMAIVPMAWEYKRDPKVIRAVRKINAYKKELHKMVNEGRITEERALRLIKDQQKILENLE